MNKFILINANARSTYLPYIVERFDAVNRLLSCAIKIEMKLKEITSTFDFQ